MKKFGLPDRDALVSFYANRRRVLEVGPGSGFLQPLHREHCRGEVFALDVSDAAFTTFENTRDLPNCTLFLCKLNLMDSPFADASFDLVIADGVLHHTPDTRAAVRACNKKGPTRRPVSSTSTKKWAPPGNSAMLTCASISPSFRRMRATRRVSLTELGRSSVASMRR